MPPGGLRRLGRLACADIGARQEPHRLAERNALLAREALDLGVAVEGRFQPRRIDLDPLAAQQRQAVGRGEQARDLLGRQRRAVEAHVDLEIEQLRRADLRGRVRADRRRDRRPARPPGSPRGRHAHDDARLLQRLDVRQQAHRLLRGPAQRMEDLAGIDDRLQPGAAFAARLTGSRSFRSSLFAPAPAYSRKAAPSGA